jgi:hypothetical protein
MLKSSCRVGVNQDWQETLVRLQDPSSSSQICPLPFAPLI